MGDFINRAREIAIRSSTLRISLRRLEYFIEHAEFESEDGDASKIRAKTERRIVRLVAKARKMAWAASAEPIESRKKKRTKTKKPIEVEIVKPWVMRPIKRRYRPLRDYDA